MGNIGECFFLHHEYYGYFVFNKKRFVWEVSSSLTHTWLTIERARIAWGRKGKKNPFLKKMEEKSILLKISKTWYLRFKRTAPGFPVFQGWISAHLFPKDNFLWSEP